MSAETLRQTFEQVVAGESIAPPCECGMHDRWGFSGSAAWVLVLSPTRPCGCPRSPKQLVCRECLARWMNRIGLAECGTCGWSTSRYDIRSEIVRLEPIGGAS